MNRYSIIPAAILLFIIISCDSSENKEKKTDEPVADSKQVQDTSKKSIPMETTVNIGNASIRINYHSPGVRGRIIWGGLVPYDQVWVTGAHKATSIEVSKSFTIGGKKIPAGKYAIFSIPGKEEWTVIINKNWNQHLTDDYNAGEDIIRFKVKPELTGFHTERLKYAVELSGNSDAIISISWEKIKISFPVKIEN